MSMASTESKDPIPPRPVRYRSFSTKGMREHDRIERWEWHNAQALIGLACRPIDDTPLEATEHVLELPRMRLAHVSANPHVVERTSDHIRGGTTDGVALYFSLHGEAFFYHQDGVHLQQPGTLLACDVSQPFLRGFAHGLEEYVLSVPREVFEDVAEQSLPRTPVMLRFDDVPGASVHAATLARLIRRSLDAPGDSEALAATERNALELLHSLFTAQGAHTAAAYRRLAIAWIERNLRDPSLSVPKVARAIGVSERHLTRAFAETGTGVARTILERRLDLAHRILTTPGAPTVREVAAYCGFASAAHFGRVFKERYEVTPAEAARQASRIPTALTIRDQAQPIPAIDATGSAAWQDHDSIGTPRCRG